MCSIKTALKNFRKIHREILKALINKFAIVRYFSVNFEIFFRRAFL